MHLFQRHQSVREPMMSMVPEEASIQSSSNLDERPASTSEPPSIEKEREIQTAYEPREHRIPFDKGPDIQTAFDQKEKSAFGDPVLSRDRPGPMRSRAASTLAQVKTVGAISTSVDALNAAAQAEGARGPKDFGGHYQRSGMNTLPRYLAPSLSFLHSTYFMTAGNLLSELLGGNFTTNPTATTTAHPPAPIKTGYSATTVPSTKTTAAFLSNSWVRGIPRTSTAVGVAAAAATGCTLTGP